MQYVISAFISALIAAAVSGLGLYLNRYWQIRQEVRTENLTHYRLLKTMGFIFMESGTGLFDSEQAVENLRKGLVEVGTALYELDLSASPAVLHSIVSFFRESDAFDARLEQLAHAGKKLSSAEFETLKAGIRKAYVAMVLAMRADAGRSNRGLKKEDLEYLLFIRLGHGQDQERANPQQQQQH